MSTEPIKNIEDILRDASDEEIMAWCLSTYNGDQTVINDIFQGVLLFVRANDDMRDEIHWRADIATGKRDDDTCRRIFDRFKEEEAAGNREAALKLRDEIHNIYLYEREMNGGRPYGKGDWK